jgi:Domain of Unknown Function (DUF1206)
MTSLTRRARRVRSHGRARETQLSPALRGLARIGLIARGVLYILLGVVVILVAFGATKQPANQQGALQLLAGKPYGVFVLWLLALGFLAYALWRLSDAWFGLSGGSKGTASRLKPLGSAVIYAGFAYLTFKILAGRQGNQVHQQQDLTARAMHYPAGRWLVGLVGLIVVVVGVVMASEGVRRKFLERLRTGQMSARTRRVVTLLGTVGTTARGVVIALAGGLVIDAAVSYKSAQSGGIDKALLTLRDQPFGEVLTLLAALGLLAFGLYGLAEARWRQV